MIDNTERSFPIAATNQEENSSISQFAHQKEERRREIRRRQEACNPDAVGAGRKDVFGAGRMDGIGQVIQPASEASVASDIDFILACPVC